MCEVVLAMGGPRGGGGGGDILANLQIEVHDVVRRACRCLHRALRLMSKRSAQTPPEIGIVMMKVSVNLGNGVGLLFRVFLVIFAVAVDSESRG